MNLSRVSSKGALELGLGLMTKRPRFIDGSSMLGTFERAAESFEFFRLVWLLASFFEMAVLALLGAVLEFELSVKAFKMLLRSREIILVSAIAEFFEAIWALATTVELSNVELVEMLIEPPDLMEAL